LLVAVAWADERLDDAEKAGVRGAAKVLNLTKELRDRLDTILEQPVPVESLFLEEMSPRDKEFAYVAAAWMAGADESVDEREEALLDKLSGLLGLDAVRKADLERVARNLEREEAGARKWSDELVNLFKTIPARLDLSGDEIEVTIE
jgi:uncharacterized membrane protein YebE (DUF533 family)